MNLNTKLEHIQSEKEFHNAIENNENIMICCGRMGPMCIPIYHEMELLKEKYTNIRFMDMSFDLPEARVIKELPECRGFMDLPFTVYYKNGKLVEATTSIQSKEQITMILDNKLNN